MTAVAAVAARRELVFGDEIILERRVQFSSGVQCSYVYCEGCMDTRLQAEILAMDPEIIALENKIAVEQDASARTRLETELADLNKAYNERVQQEQVKLAKSQTLERYIEKGKSWVDSLQNQAATQMVLINKLQTLAARGCKLSGWSPCRFRNRASSPAVSWFSSRWWANSSSPRCWAARAR